ncbi:MAG: hypothetical protein AB7T10_02395 [bacterium]
MLAGCLSIGNSSTFTNSEPYYRGGSNSTGIQDSKHTKIIWSMTLSKDEQFISFPTVSGGRILFIDDLLLSWGLLSGVASAHTLRFAA